jgi:hypothetical protein
MILSEMITMLASLLAVDLDNRNAAADGTVTNLQATSDINWAIRFISQRIYQFDPSIVFTVTAETASYNLESTTIFSRKILEARRVIINGNQLYNCQGNKYGMWALGEVERECPTWRADLSGTPSKAFQVGTTLYLHQKPNAAVLSAGSNYIAGQYLAADLHYVNDLANSPDIPLVLHEAVVRMAADFAADPTATEAEALQRLMRYTGKAGVDIELIAKRNKRLAEDWGSTSGATRGNFTRV